MKFSRGDKVQFTGTDGTHNIGTFLEELPTPPGVCLVQLSPLFEVQVLISDLKPWPTRWERNPFDPGFRGALE